MIPVWLAASLALAYVSALLAVAYGAERARAAGRSPSDNAWVFVLSLGVYCTSWTFYGSVGRAAGHGLDFLPIYIGPTLVFLLAPVLLVRLVSFSRSHGVTSVPDLLEALYGQKRTLGTLAAVLLVLGITPYLGLQLRAVGHTFDLITGGTGAAGTLGDPALWAAFAFGGFAVLFGARTLTASERHEGLVLAVAVESAVKLIAFLVVGSYIVWYVGDGIGPTFASALDDPLIARRFIIGPDGGTTVGQWLSLTVMSASAVMLLPRQFQMLAVENAREKHILRATWAFPAYLFLITLLALPVALVGLLQNVPGPADYFVLTVPLSRGHKGIAFLAFLGGVSAATSMLMVSSVALSTVVLHHLAMPTVLRRWSGERDLSRPLLHIKRITIFAVILLGYGFHRWIGESRTLVDTGLISFCAVLQLAPAVLLGLFWPGVTRTGATAGLGAGFAVWIVTMLVPVFARGGVLDPSILSDGLFGISALRPEALFWLSGLDPWTHALSWTLLLNLGLCVGISLASRAGPRRETALLPMGGEESRDELRKLLVRFVDQAQVDDLFRNLPPDCPSRKVLEAAERCLASAVGTAAARTILQGYLAMPQGAAVEILDVFGSVSRRLTESRETMERRLRELSVLHEASGMLASSLDVDTMLTRILRLIQREFGFDHLGVRLLNARGQLEIRSRIGIDDEYAEYTKLLPSRDTMFGRAFLDRKPVVVGDASHAPPSTHFQQLRKIIPVTALIHVPMIHEGRSIGVLMAYSTRGPMHFTEEFISLFSALANQMALAVVNANLYREVRAYSQAMEERVRQRTAQLQAANERLRELDRLKSEFLSNVSHELRTPLTSIQSFSEILLHYDVHDPAKRRRFAEIIAEEAMRLTRLINDLLDLSRIEAGRLDLTLVPVDLEAAILRAMTNTGPLFAENGVTVEHEVEAGLPPVSADRDRLAQVLTNLLGNAAKFAPPRSTVRLKARRRGAFAMVSVSDEGPGIDPRMLREVFERYKQLRDPAKHQALGTGLGLAISRDLVERFGGYIWVESLPGRGSTFYFTLPIAEAETAAPAA